MKKLKNYDFEITVKWSQSTEAENKTRAIEIIKEVFEEEYNIALTNKEILYIRNKIVQINADIVVHKKKPQVELEKLVAYIDKKLYDK